MCQATEASENSEKKSTTSTYSAAATQPVVYRQLSQGLERSISDLEERKLRVASEMLDHLIAGHETSGITLTYLMHEMSQRPELQSKLREELLTLSPPIIY